ncbi:MAG: hypothetical protein VX096_04085 [Pseudomonadota bacterium]|nr:hypothetical protein [Pseudomonadota bacterium]
MSQERVLIIGKSKKFIKGFKKALNEENIEIISWRDLKHIRLDNIQFNLIILCGYHHESYSMSYKSYFESNVIKPLEFMSTFDEKSTQVIYVNTSNPTKKYTFSRYCYAKHYLAVELNKRFNRFLSIDIPLLKDNKGNMEFYSNSFERFFAVIVSRLKKYKILHINDLPRFLKMKISEQKVYEIGNIQGKYLWIRRTRFLDKIFRIIFG